ncbi:MAG: hypothetical protein ONB43_16665 [candidate division KSB1 bacterium]|nr:hypothetical protein [candidate division KSB1 bacterium]
MKSAILKLGVAMLAIVLLVGMWFSVQPVFTAQEIRATRQYCIVTYSDGTSRSGCDICPGLFIQCIDCTNNPPC